jgi:phosphoribosylglycinamide formyltransferase-1
MSLAQASKVRTAVLVSGRGSNLRSLLAAASAPDYPAEIVLVLSNNPDAGGLEIARAAGVAAQAVDHRPFGKDRAAHEAALDARLRAAGVELIALAGYMRVLTPAFVAAWRGRMINIHPSLLPAFPGLHTHARALEAGHARHGATVHWVSEGVDEGEVIGQAEVPVLPGDDPDTLAARVLEVEHRLYPQCLALAAKTVLARRAAPLTPLP